jgi:hypothetical protein
MIDLETKEKLLKEIEKSGNVYLSCMKTGIDKATFYRWKDDKEFRKKANEAVKRGRENNCEIAEHALMMNVKDKKMDAIKYVLSHQSKIYKPKDRKVFLVHSNTNNSEKAVSIKRKGDIRTYSAGYTDGVKSFLEDHVRKSKKHRHTTEEEVLERVEEIRSGKADDLNEDLMEEARTLYAKENGEVPEEPDDHATNKIILDLPKADEE